MSLRHYGQHPICSICDAETRTPGKIDRARHHSAQFAALRGELSRDHGLTGSILDRTVSYLGPGGRHEGDLTTAIFEAQQPAWTPDVSRR